MNDMPWIIEARSFLGVAEVPGHEFNPVIREFWYVCNGRWLWEQLGKDDGKAPWCGCFVAHCMREVGCSLPVNPWRAKAWLNWGSPIFSTEPSLDRPVPGCVAVFERKGGGHVGFVVGADRSGRLMVLGGNQGDRVSILPFDAGRVLGYRWPAEFAQAVPVDPLPIFSPALASSRDES